MCNFKLVGNDGINWVTHNKSISFFFGGRAKVSKRGERKKLGDTSMADPSSQIILKLLKEDMNYNA